MSNLTDEQKANLAKLATYLENLPEDYKHFGMQDYANIEQKLAVVYGLNNGGFAKYAQQSEQSCGSCACAVGHGPAAGILLRRDEVNSRWGEETVSWDTYSRRVFADPFSPEWDYMFSNEWTALDNTHRGAAARIRYVLSGIDVKKTNAFDEDGDFCANEWWGSLDVEDILAEYEPFLVRGDDHIKASAQPA